MIRISFARRIALVLALVASSASLAHAQCLITGPDTMCSTALTLCGPQGEYVYAWRLPDGSTASTPCIEAMVPGTYSLRVYDRLNGMWFGPCTHVVSLGDMSSGTCLITGATDGCTGDTLALCGPAGMANHVWTGPGGFTDTATCVRVTVPGTYQLAVDDGAGCFFATCSANVTFHSCATRVSCPKPPSFFAGACGRHGHPTRLDPSQLATLAACVNDRSAAFDWKDPRAGFCSAMRLDFEGVRERAKRQVAAVWANVCAGDLGLTAQGASIVLDRATPVSLAPLYSGTVGDWLAMADQRLLDLEKRPSRDHVVRLGYHQLVMVGWMIDHGLAIGPTCVRPTGTTVRADDAELPVVDGESLAEELVDTPSSGLALGRPNPNPFSSAMTLDYAVDGGGDTEVRIGVYDVSGRLVRTLVSAIQSPGDYQARWDGRDEGGAAVRNGVYFVIGHLGGQRVQTRVTVVR